MTAIDWHSHELKMDALIHYHPLRYLFLEVTRKCNYRCVYCGSNCSSVSQSQELSSEEWMDVLKDIAKDFNPRKVMIALTGGEPLFKEGIFDIIKTIKGYGFPFGMVTNGSLINTPQMARELIKSGIGSISISLDGPAEINDKNRQIGSFQDANRAVKLIRQTGYRGKLEIISTITTPVIDHLKQFRKLLTNMGIQLWRLTPLVPIGRAINRPDLVPDKDNLRKILEFIMECRRDKLKPKPEFCEEGYLGDEFEMKVRPFLSQCRSGITVAGILADGSIGACPELGKEFIQGHISNDRLKDVWENGYDVFRDRTWTKKGICGECQVFDRCRGGSLHLYNNMESPICRCFYKMLEDD